MLSFGIRSTTLRATSPSLCVCGQMEREMEFCASFLFTLVFYSDLFYPADPLFIGFLWKKVLY